MGEMETVTPVIELRGASVVYRKGKEEVAALRGVDFTLAPGEFVTVTGPSGAGKSTFLQLCGGILSPTSGEVRFLGRARGALKDHELAQLRSRDIGFVFQSFNLIDYLPAEENVALPLMLAGVREDERLQRARQRLDSLGLGHRRGHYPGELSGGECQRVAIARALVTDPPLLIADEPTGNLDHESSAVVMELFAAIHREGTSSILLVTHSPWVAAFGSRTVRIDNGVLA
jgi:ABC-type lipoprotein export system ATPase subunit